MRSVKKREAELSAILLEPLFVPTSVVGRGGSYLISWCARESDRLEIRRASARAELAFICSREDELQLRVDIAFLKAVDGIRASAKTFSDGLTPILREMTEAMRRFGIAYASACKSVVDGAREVEEGPRS